MEDEIPPSLVEKAKELNLVLSEPDVDLWKLREFAISEGGLVNDTIRRRAWPKLVGLAGMWEDIFENNKPPSASSGVAASRGGRPPPRPRPRLPPAGPRSASAKIIPDDEISVFTAASSNSTASSRRGDIILAKSDDFDQIERDVARCTWHLLTGTQRVQRLQMEHKRHKKVARLIRRKQRRLANLINLTLVQSYKICPSEDKLRYYQGYHDVACIFLSTLGGAANGNSQDSSLESMAASMGLALPAAVLLQVSQSHLRDCLKKNFVQLQTALRLTLFPLIAALDPQVHDFLYQTEMEPFFAISWVITWFAHEIRDTELVKRLFDVFLVSHPLFPIYVSVAMVLHPINKDELLTTEQDFALVHQTLTGLPKNSSMVGWKYRPGDGYVSDDEDDEGTVSTDAIEHQYMEGEFIVSDLQDNDRGDQVSLVGSSLSSLLEPPARVPFQELIENAIVFMAKIPPRKLLALAKRYYGVEKVETMLSSGSDINLLQEPPDWSTTRSVKADWVLKQRARQRRGLSPTSRRDRRRSRSRSTTRDGVPTREASETTLLLEEEEDSNDYIKKEKKSAAVIALGFGTGDDDERKRRKRRRLMMMGAVSVAIVAIFLGIVFQKSETPEAVRDSQRQRAEEITTHFLSTGESSHTLTASKADLVEGLDPPWTTQMNLPFYSESVTEQQTNDETKKNPDSRVDTKLRAKHMTRSVPEDEPPDLRPVTFEVIDSSTDGPSSLPILEDIPITQPTNEVVSNLVLPPTSSTSNDLTLSEPPPLSNDVETCKEVSLVDKALNWMIPSAARSDMSVWHDMADVLIVSAEREAAFLEQFREMVINPANRLFSENSFNLLKEARQRLLMKELEFVTEGMKQQCTTLPEEENTLEIVDKKPHRGRFFAKRLADFRTNMEPHLKAVAGTSARVVRRARRSILISQLEFLNAQQKEIALYPENPTLVQFMQTMQNGVIRQAVVLSRLAVTFLETEVIPRIQHFVKVTRQLLLNAQKALASREIEFLSMETEWEDFVNAILAGLSNAAALSKKRLSAFHRAQLEPLLETLYERLREAVYKALNSDVYREFQQLLEQMRQSDLAAQVEELAIEVRRKAQQTLRELFAALSDVIDEFKELGDLAEQLDFE